MSEHQITSTDRQVRGRPGTVSRCTCGWSSSWAVRDGSAEADAHGHQMNHDPEHRATVQQAREESQRLSAKGCKCTTFYDGPGRIVSHGCPVHGHEWNGPMTRIAPPVPDPRIGQCHDCACHINPPCGQCENCRHPDHPECPNDCQDCEEHDDEH